MSRKGRLFMWEFWVVLVLTLGVLSVLLFPIFFQARIGNGRGVVSNLKQVGLALVMYAGDYDERLPLKDTWMDATFPYCKSWSTYVDPAFAESPPSRPIGRYGFAFFGPL